MMSNEKMIADGIYLIAGPNISRAEDAAAFIIDCGEELVMIDSGAGNSAELLVKNILDVGLDPGRLSTLILTHCHIDHIGSAPYFRGHFNCMLVAHSADADAIEAGDPDRTAAPMYGTEFPPTPVDRRLTGDDEILRFGDQEIHCLHTPGHTPGSMSPYLDRGDKRILFGQDIHGPFLKSFGSDIEEWEQSMKKLLALQADILCEGHFGIFRSRGKVEAYIGRYLEEYA